jgi:hypothetical protein
VSWLDSTWTGAAEKKLFLQTCVIVVEDFFYYVFCFNTWCISVYVRDIKREVLYFRSFSDVQEYE